jgi:hypothetical protein
MQNGFAGNRFFTAMALGSIQINFNTMLFVNKKGLAKNCTYSIRVALAEELIFIGEFSFLF